MNSLKACHIRETLLKKYNFTNNSKLNQKINNTSVVALNKESEKQKETDNTTQMQCFRYLKEQ